MRAMSRADRLRIKRSFIAAGVFCAAAGGAFAVSAEKLPYILEETAFTAAELMYGGCAPEEPQPAAPAAAGAVDAVSSVIVRSTVDDSRMLSYGSNIIMPSAADEDPVFIEGSMEQSVREGDADSTDGNDRDGPITDVMYGRCTGERYIDLDGGGQVRNLTDMPDSELTALSRMRPDIRISADGSPEVLIIHTHATECFESQDRDWYDSTVSSRSTDPGKNMCAVGREIALKLTESGIGVIHDTTLHDYPSYNGAYDRSRITAAEILKEYPTIKTVLDIHRDAIERDGVRIAPTTEINGRKAAQIMIICGCDDGTMGMPDFRENFKYACLLQSGFESRFPTLTRPVLFDHRHYNQDMTTGSLLIEIGSHANTLDEAEYSGQLVGEALAEILLGLKDRR